MANQRQYHRLLARLKTVAETETQAMLKAAPAEFRERVSGVTVQFEGSPTKDMLARGVDSEAVSTTDRDGHAITIFLMTLHQRCGPEPGRFRQELRRVMLTELADCAGMDVQFEE